jgi:hypothetical protein
MRQNCIYLDNWYSPPRPYTELHKRGTNACRTVQKNRVGLPKDADKKTLKRGETEVQQLPPLTYVIWNDKRDVSVLSNYHARVDMIDTGKQDTKTKLQIIKPNIIHEYNKYMVVVC